MPTPDPAKAIKTAVAGDWSTAHPSWTATLHVDDDFKPAAGSPVLLVANDGGPRMNIADKTPGAWLVRKTPRREVIRFTGYGAGRDEARSVVDAGVDYLLAHKPGISRIEDVSSLLETRDRATGAFLASITVPVIVRPTS